MAETLTYDSTPADAPELNEQEQEALQVGEKLAEEEQQLLAGKFQNAEELEKAYVELQKKLGSNSEEETEASTEEAEEKTEEESNPALSLINEASAEYYKNDNTLSPETIEKFSSMSSQDLVSAYLELQKNAPQQETETVKDLSESDINSIKNSVGGDKEYDNIISWAAQNLPEQRRNAFDNLINNGDVEIIQLAVAGLKAQYETANGYEGRLLSGKSAKTSGDVFRSQAEVVQAMNDPRYDRDEAYRQDIYQKLERSNLKF
jgi:hypothetical protein